MERILEQQRLLPEVLELAYGTELAGLLISIAEAMNEAQLAGQITSLEDHPTWIDDAFALIWSRSPRTLYSKPCALPGN